MAEYDEKTHTAVSIEDYNKLKAESARLKTTETKLQEQISANESLKNDFSDLEKKKQPKQGATKEEREEIEAAVRAELGGRLTEAETKTQTLEKQLRSATVTDRVMQSLGDKVVSSAQKWIRQEIEKECDIEGDFSNPTVVVKDEKGNVRWSAKKPDQKMDLSEYSEVLQSRYPEFFVSTARQGEADKGQNTGKAGASGAQVQSVDFNRIRGMTNEELRNVPVNQLKQLIDG